MKKRFPPHFRLRSKADFSELRQGRKLTSGNLRLIYRGNGLHHARLGLAVSRKYGNAVRRNRLKRQLRESFRLSSARNEAVDVLAIPLCSWPQAQDINRDMEQGLKQIVKRIHRNRE